MRGCLRPPYACHRGSAPAAHAAFRIGQAYLWREGAEFTLIGSGDVDAAAGIEGAVRALGADPASVRRIVLAHGHRDHTGSARELADRYGAEVLAHRLDASVIRGTARVPQPVLLDWEIPLYEHARTVPRRRRPRWTGSWRTATSRGSAAETRVVHVPGHTDGSIAVHLPRHGALFTGDAVAGVGQVMPGVFTVDRAAALASMRRLASLAPSTVCFGHGDPVTRDAAAALSAAADAAS
ncbi:MBL fold metallo-hydrolase [Streptomyces sp. NPDC091376]|uniref:MBL fold metallo-hydrolase n=1 Tax=Streptomyces sp. NPDC091376 TaxID=3365994 RepID=UPI0037F76AF4